jgi:hypothetical protein
MKTIAFVLFVLLVIQSWGVYGAARTQGVRHRCTMKVGPLCYLWEETAVAKLLGEDRMDKVEEALEEAKQAWEEEVVQKITGKGGIEKVLGDVKDMAEEGAENAKKLIEEKVK